MRRLHIIVRRVHADRSSGEAPRGPAGGVAPRVAAQTVRDEPAVARKGADVGGLPTALEVAELTGATYASAYRWTTGRSRFPLASFMRVVVARGVDWGTAVTWAETWLGVGLPGGGAADSGAAAAGSAGSASGGDD